MSTRDGITNNSIFERVAAASAIEDEEPKGIFQQTAAHAGFEPTMRRREAENTFNFVWDSEDEDAEAIINLTDHYSKKYGVSRSDALYNLDGYIRDDMGKPVPKKTAWQQISDGFIEGRLTDRIGILSNQLMWANDDAEKKRLQLEIDKLEQRMPNHEYDRGGFVGAVSSASNLFGTMIRPLGVSIVTTLATSGLGTIPAVASFAKASPNIAKIGSRILSALPTFNETRKVETGLIYKDMLENGVPEQIAKKNAIAHGIIAGALETASIEVLLARFPFMKNIAKNAVLRMTARERMAQGAVKTIGKIIADNAISIPIGVVSETATEIWQEQSAIYFEKRADLQSIDDEELGKILATKQGEFERYFDEEYRKQKKDYYASDEYAQQVKDRIWEVAKQTAQGMLVFGLIGGGVNAVHDVSTVAKKDIPYRKTYKKFENLKTETDKIREERDKLRAEANKDPQNAEKREAYEKKNEELLEAEKALNMTAEAREYSELKMKTSLTEDEVERLVHLNDVLQVRRDFREDMNFDKAPEDIKHEAPQTLDVGEKRLREIVKNYTPMLTEEETDELMNLMNVRARSAGMDLDTYLKTTFQDEMAQFSENDVTTIIDKDGKEQQVRYKGNVQFAEDGKAIITLTKNADFTTWVHELGHIFRRQMGGELLSEAEKYYNVQDGVWTEEAEERFTEDLTTYLRTRRAPNTFLEKMFRIIADALNNVYDRYKERGQVSDDIARVFDQMFAEPGNAFQTTEQAVAQMSEYEQEASKIEPGQLYQLMGERGARELDTINSTDYLITNLEMAKSLEKKGESKMSILYATGWQKGADGEWKYETVDPVYEWDADNGNHIRANITQDFYKRIEKKKGIHTTLRELWGDDNRIVKAYPQLADRDIYFNPRASLTEFGSTNGDKIIIRTKWKSNWGSEGIRSAESISDTLLHEVQHWIQSEEGFAQGGEPGKTIKPTGEAYAEYQELMKEYDDFLKANGLDYGMNIYPSVHGATVYNKIIDFNNRKRRLRAKLKAITTSEYYRLAGEVEARNVSRRRLMTAKERGSSLLETTEKLDTLIRGVPQKDYLIIKEKMDAESRLLQAIDEAENLMPKTDGQTTLNQIDGEYLDAVNSGDMAKAQAMVDQRAREMGYNSPKLYHGTQEFGFTEADVSKSDDKSSFFATDSLDTARTYSAVMGVTEIGKGEGEQEVIDAENQIRKLNDDIKALLTKLDPETYNDELLSWWNIISDDDFEDLRGGNYYLGNTISELYKRLNKAYADNKANEEIYKEGQNLTSKLYYSIYAYIDAIQKLNGKGNYALYAKTDNLLEIDADGADWNSITLSDELKKDIDEYSRKTGTNFHTEDEDVSTRDIAGIADALGYEGAIIHNVYDDGGKSAEGLENHADVYIFFNPQSQVKSADPVTYDDNGKVIPLSQRFNKQNPSILYQLEEDTYRVATENGNYVPDYILENMRGVEWVEDELQWREEFRKDALEYDTYEQFLEAMIAEGGLRKDSYYENIWDTAADILPKYEAMLPHLSRTMLERMLYVMKRNVKEKKGTYPAGMLGEAVKKYEKDHKISEEEYKALMDEINSAPDKSIVFIEECFSDKAEFEEMMKSLWLSPDLEVLRIQELERVIKTNERLANFKISSLEERLEKTKEKGKQKLADQKAYYLDKERRQREARRERELYNKLVRQIFRKIPKMCDITIAEKIAEIQSMYSPTRLMDETRTRLELALMDATDDRQKAKILNKLSRKSLRDMTLAEVAELASLVTQMRHEGVQKRMEQLLASKERRLDIEAGLIKDTGEGTLDRTGSIEAKKDKGSLWDRMKSYWWDINRITEDMGEHWHEFFSEEVGKAYREELRHISRRRAALMDKMKSLGLSNKSLRQTEEINGKTYTHDILMHWYICMQNNDSAAALVFGNFKDDPNREATIKEGIDRLSDAEIELAEWMIESFSGDDRVRLWNVFRTVENRSPEIILRYFPMIRVLNKIQDVQNEPLVDLGERTHAGRAAVKKDFSFERIHNIAEQNQTPLKLGAMSTYLQAIQNQEHYIAFAQLSKDMKYIYNGVSDAVIARYGQKFYDNINKWIDRVTNPNAYKARYAQQNMFMKALSNSMAGALAGNVVTMIKQLPSMLFFLPYTDAGHMAQSLYDFAAHHKEMTEFAKEKSPYLANRNIDDYLTNLEEQLNDPNSRYRTAKEVTNALLKPIKWMDELACVVGWNSVYTSEMAKGKTEAEAIAKADEALLKTQPQATAIYSPQAYNSGSDLMRTMLVFTRQANQIFQMMTADMGKAWAEKHIKQVITMGGVLALNALLMGWISRKFGGYGDDDDESAAMDVTKDIIANLANNIPVVGPTIVPMIQRSAYTSSGYVNPISEMLNKTHRAVYKSIKTGEVDFDTAMRLITDSMGVAGLPKVLTWRAYKALKDEDIWTLFIGAPLGGKDGSK